ncbi:unnamed protein product [Nyctereutes procyonoides]|uniref:(raccoon dog) hypothetical protein n=1 Tax=Nyctereutes procyonoides TaxID=34880 RepID=A0A811YE33_NYCPR|nr:unnamed protein product [Nyctereutes procyonoides]
MGARPSEILEQALLKPLPTPRYIISLPSQAPGQQLFLPSGPVPKCLTLKIFPSCGHLGHRHTERGRDTGRGRSRLHAGSPTLQTGMRGAFGKPQGTVARVHTGQVIMSICTKLQNKEHVIEIHISKKWGFTKFNVDEFEDTVAEKQLIPDGCGVKYIPNRGPLDKWRALHS